MATEFVRAVTSLSAGVSDSDVAETLLANVMEITGAAGGAVRLGTAGQTAWVSRELSAERADRLNRHVDFQCGAGRSLRCGADHVAVSSLGSGDRPASLLRVSCAIAFGRALDVVLVDSCRVDGFSVDDQAAVEALVAVAALAVSNREQSVSRRRFEEWMAVIEETATILLRGVAPRAALDGVLDDIARTALRTTGAEMAGVAIPDEYGSSMVFRVAVGSESKQLLSAEPFPEEGSLSGAVRRGGEPLLVADAVLDPRSYHPVSTRIGLGPTAVGPLWLNERAIGIVFVGNHRHGRELDAELALRAVTHADLAEHFRISAEQHRSLIPTDVEGTRSFERLAAFGQNVDEWFRLLELDARETDMLIMVAEGLTNQEIADRLHLAEKTVRNAMSDLWVRLGVKNRVQAAVLVARHVERLGRLGAISTRTSGDG